MKKHLILILTFVALTTARSEPFYITVAGQCRDESWIAIFSKRMDPGQTESNLIGRELFYKEIDPKLSGKTWVGALVSATPARNPKGYKTDFVVMFRELLSRKPSFQDGHYTFSLDSKERQWSFYDFPDSDGSFSRLAVLVTKDASHCKNPFPPLPK